MIGIDTNELEKAMRSSKFVFDYVDGFLTSAIGYI